MILSHKHKFIFIKTQKTAGTSIEVFLSPHCGEEDVVTPIWPHVEPHQARNYKGFTLPVLDVLASGGRGVRGLLKNWRMGNRFYNHMPAWLVRRRVPRSVWDGYFKFCVERNPWDKTLSHYHMARHRSDQDLSLDEFMARGKFPLNHPIYTDPSTGKVLVDRVLRYENLDQELGRVCEELGIPWPGSLRVKAKGAYRGERKPYDQVLTPEQAKVIENAFEKEIQLHGYVF